MSFLQTSQCQCDCHAPDHYQATAFGPQPTRSAYDKDDESHGPVKRPVELPRRQRKGYCGVPAPPRKYGPQPTRSANNDDIDDDVKKSRLTDIGDESHVPVKRERYTGYIPPSEPLVKGYGPRPKGWLSTNNDDIDDDIRSQIKTERQIEMEEFLFLLEGYLASKRQTKRKRVYNIGDESHEPVKQRLLERPKRHKECACYPPPRKYGPQPTRSANNDDYDDDIEESGLQIEEDELSDMAVDRVSAPQTTRSAYNGDYDDDVEEPELQIEKDELSDLAVDHVSAPQTTRSAYRGNYYDEVEESGRQGNYYDEVEESGRQIEEDELSDMAVNRVSAPSPTRCFDFDWGWSDDDDDDDDDDRGCSACSKKRDQKRKKKKNKKKTSNDYECCNEPEITVTCTGSNRRNMKCSSSKKSCKKRCNNDPEPWNPSSLGIAVRVSGAIESTYNVSGPLPTRGTYNDVFDDEGDQDVFDDEGDQDGFDDEGDQDGFDDEGDLIEDVISDMGVYYEPWDLLDPTLYPVSGPQPTRGAYNDGFDDVDEDEKEGRITKAELSDMVENRVSAPPPTRSPYSDFCYAPESMPQEVYYPPDPIPMEVYHPPDPIPMEIPGPQPLRSPNNEEGYVEHIISKFNQLEDGAFKEVTNYKKQHDNLNKSVAAVDESKSSSA